jgi:hypothetical protein
MKYSNLTKSMSSLAQDNNHNRFLDTEENEEEIV